MDFIKEWTLCICITMIIAIILSYLSPDSTNGKFYKMLVKIFILLAFIIPFKNSNFELPKLKYISDEQNIIEQQHKDANEIIENKISSVLKTNNISGANIKVISNINDFNEIDINKITVILPDDYECDVVKNLIFEKLSLNVDVIHIGQ